MTRESLLIFAIVLACFAALLLRRDGAQAAAVPVAASASQLYGVDGFNVIADAESYPAYATVTVRSVDQTVVWASSSTDSRALQKASVDGDRIAAAWSSMQSSFDVDIQITDGQTHQVSLYFLDWDFKNRAQRLAVIAMTDSNGTLADYRLIESFSRGVYAIYNISGHVIFRVWRESDQDAVLSGLFFQPTTTATPTPTPTPSPSPTVTPTATPTPAPTATPTPTPLPSPTPCRLLPNGKCRKN